MKKKKFLIIKIILIVLISIFIGFGIYVWNAQMVGNTIPMPLGFGLAEVVSDSMYPTIKTGDVIMVVPQDEYEVDDIVAFKDSIGIVTHRIIEENDDGTFVTKGDFKDNTADDIPLRKEYIIGKVVKTFAGFGAFVSIMQSPAVIIMFVVIIALLLFLSTKKEKEADEADIAKIKKEIAALKQENDDKTIDDIQAQIDALKKKAEDKNERDKKK